MNTQVKDLMKKNPVLISPLSTLQDAAKKMRDIECGVLPVGTADRLEGVITDRDIVTRAVSRGKNIAKELVRDYMTPEIFSCHETDTLEKAIDKMRTHKINRILVRNATGKLTGILSFGGILKKNKDNAEVANVVKHVLSTQAA